MRLPVRARMWTRLLSVVALLAAAYFTLIPRTALYYAHNGHPQDVEALYTWATGDDQTIIGDFSESGNGPIRVSERVGCGTAFTSGPYEDERPGDGPEACSAIETPRRIGALLLLVLAVAGLFGARRLPEPRFERL